MILVAILLFGLLLVDWAHGMILRARIRMLEDEVDSLRNEVRFL